MNTYLSGTLVTTTANFANKNGVPTDPDTITLKYKHGSNAVVTVAYPTSPIVRDTTGAYHADLDTTGWTGPGNELWTAEWIGTGAVQVPGIDNWQVEPLTL